MTVSSVAVRNGVWSPQPLVPSAPPLTTDTGQSRAADAGELHNDPRSSATLSNIASQQRVSGSPLVAKVQSDLEATAAEDAPTQPTGKPGQVAAGVTGHKPPASTLRDRGAVFLSGPTSVRAESNLASLADTLGTDPATLLAQLGTGRHLSSLLAAGGDAGYGTSNVRPSVGGILVDQYA